tara:strand:+ start:522 stop:1109 length:588 start_codon:yes stop_codon:yes gene_type:complete
MSNKYIPRLQEKYKNEICASLSKKLNIDNVMRLPKLEKIIINMGMGDARDHQNWLKQAEEEIAIISGQKPIVTRAKKAISNFKLRQNDPVGIKVNLRRNNMYEFLDRFISVAAPRIRDFRGLKNNSFDGRGNYNFGIDEQIIFPEIDYDKVNQIRGMNITIVTSAHTDEEAYELLMAFGMPLKERKNNNQETDES